MAFVNGIPQKFTSVASYSGIQKTFSLENTDPNNQAFVLFITGANIGKINVNIVELRNDIVIPTLTQAVLLARVAENNDTGIVGNNDEFIANTIAGIVENKNAGIVGDNVEFILSNAENIDKNCAGISINKGENSEEFNLSTLDTALLLPNAFTVNNDSERDNKDLINSSMLNTPLVFGGNVGEGNAQSNDSNIGCSSILNVTTSSPPIPNFVHDYTNDPRLLAIPVVKIQPIQDTDFSASTNNRRSESRRGRKHCDECNYTFNTASVYNSHKLLMHSTEGRLLKCIRCNKSFASAGGLSFHMRSVHRVHFDQCENGNSAIKDNISKSKDHVETRSSYKSKLRKPTESNNTDGGAASNTDTAIGTVSLMVDNTNSLPCVSYMYDAGSDDDNNDDDEAGDDNAANSSTDSVVKAEVDDQTESEDYIRPAGDVNQSVGARGNNHCSFCNKSFSSFKTLKIHMLRKHITDKAYKCAKCDRSFAIVRDYNQHMKVSHGVPLPKKTKNINPQAASSAQIVSKRRIPSVTDSDPDTNFRCAFCKKSFSTFELLKEHKSSLHSKTRPRQCTQCDKIFSEVNDLSEHMRNTHGVLSDNSNLHAESSPAVADKNSEKSGKSPDKNLGTKGVKKRRGLKKKDKYEQNITSGKECVCHICNKQFPSNFKMKGHIRRVHINNKGYQCEICYESYKSQLQLNVHIKLVHTGIKLAASSQKHITENRPDGGDQAAKQATCFHCKKNFDNLDHLRQHIEICRSGIGVVKSDFRCNECNLAFNVEGYLIHMREKHADLNMNINVDEEFRCLFCEKSFPLFNMLKMHTLRVHSKDRPYHCTQCNKTFSVSYDLTYHMRKKHSKTASNSIKMSNLISTRTEAHGSSEGNVQPVIGGNSETSHEAGGRQMESLLYAATSSSTQQPAVESTNSEVQQLETSISRPQHWPEGLSCELCDFVADSFSSLRIHFKYKHPTTKARPHICLRCHARFPSILLLSSHSRLVHKDKKSYKCVACSKMFAEPYARDSHYRFVHCREQGYPCEVCGKEFFHEASLKHHRRTVHEGQKRYMCEVCGYKASSASAINRHIAIVHKGERAFQCSECGATFKSSHGCQGHIDAIHKGIRHTCEFCGKVYSRLSHLRMHFKLHHSGVRYYPCTKCKRIFKTDEELEDHISVKHIK